MIEVLEHTADIGLRISADSLNNLFAEAAKGLFSLLIENVNDICESRQLTIELQADRLDDLLFDWLSELLYCFEVRKLVLSRFDVNITQTRLHATVFGEPCSQRHILSHEVKAVTYHQLFVTQTPQDCCAQVILDI